MTASWRRGDWRLGLVSALAVVGAIVSSSRDYALAQIAPDATLGAEGSNVTPFNAGGFSGDIIQGGATQGTNLFHSFEQFSVLTGRFAFFNNAADIQNIISRVTGGTVSNIDGLIAANGTANLFLINPNGIIFGPNASLGIGGSFVGSTASSLNFADGTQFSATAPQTTPLLTVSVPIGLQFGGTAGSIVNQSRATNGSRQRVGLQVPSGRTLALVGGDVRLDGGRLEAPDGRVELGGVAGAGTVGLNFDSNNLLLSFPDGVARADVYLTNSGSNTARVNVAGSNGGNIAINARNIDIAGESSLRGGLETGLGFPGAEAGDIELSAIGAINVANGTIANDVRTGSVGQGGNINVTAGSLSVTNGAQLQASTFGQGDAGSVNINARDTVSFDGVGSNGFSSAAFSTVEAGAVGNGGGINVTAGSLSVTDSAQLQSLTRDRGNAGSVNINAHDTVSFDGGYAFSQVASTAAVGNAGDINITTGSLALRNGARLSASTFGQGNAGSVFVQANDSVALAGGGTTIDSNINSGAVGKDGSINITTGSLAVTDGAQLSTSIYGQGNAGSVNINARDTVSFNGIGSNGFPSAIFNEVDVGAVGNGGSINITAGSLAVTDGAEISACSCIQGNGDGGNITINVNTLEAVNGGQIHTSSASSGKAGNITVNATDSIILSGSDRTYFDRLVQFGIVSFDGPASGLFSSTSEESTGQGGYLSITTRRLIVQDSAEVTVSSQGLGDAGNLEVVADSIRLDNQALLSSNTTAGQGYIFLSSRDLVLRRGSNITTNATGTAVGGNITIDTNVLAALENSDIIATAQEAFGGQVRISASAGIFGTEFRNQRTSSSDITASSDLGPEFSGTVELNTPDVDPSRGLVELPAEVVDASELIARGCAAGDRESSQFVVTGRGGLPPNPDEPLSSDAVWEDARLPATTANQQRSATVTATPPSQPGEVEIVPATGWVFNDKGEVTLIAQAPNRHPYNFGSTPVNCDAR